MTAYETLLQKILDEGETRGDRTGTGTISLFGTQMEFDLTEEFPLLTSKKVAWEKVYEELFWFLRGETNILSLLEKGVHIWSEWPYKAYLEKTGQPVPEDKESSEWKEGIKEFEAKILDDVEFARTWGDLGPVYGSQWRKWTGPDGTVIDQIACVIESIKTNRYSRRHIVSAWNPAEVDQMKLPPCHALFQFYVHTDDRLSCQLYQRSADMFLGVPFNIASYALLTHIIADQCGLKPGKFVWTGGETHVYLNHLEQSRLQLSREERPLPKLALKDTPNDISRYTGDNLVLLGYHPHPGIKAPIAV